ncbi:MAG: GTPase HflX, partial [Candidatus Omnitrophota bacterium]
MERALLVTVKLEHEKGTWDVVERERELRELAVTAGAKVVKEELCHRDKPTPDLYVGEGKASEIADVAYQQKIRTVIFNNDLTGTQKRNLEETIQAKVVDRTQLILDIFARHAKSPEGKAQVELAQLEYLLPRLSGKRTELSRLGGGIGTRGPGEQKLEED